MKGSDFFVVISRFLICLTMPFVSGVGQVLAADEGKTIFEQKCVACHTIGGGKKVGPDLKGVTERRDIPWLKGFIQSPSSYLAKDETAQGLLKEYGVPMPDLGLKDDEVEVIIAYLKGSELQAGGTTARPSRYFLTLGIALGGVLLLTLIGLIAGRKKVEVR